MILTVTVGSLFPCGRLEGSWLRRDHVLQPCLHPGMATRCEWEWWVSFSLPVLRLRSSWSWSAKTSRPKTHQPHKAQVQEWAWERRPSADWNTPAGISGKWTIPLHYDNHWTVFVSAAGVTLINMLLHPMVIHAFTHSINIHKISYARFCASFLPARILYTGLNIRTGY